MDEVHKNHMIHNYFSLDNVLTYFPSIFENVYIGVCDWRLVTLTKALKVTLYVFESCHPME